MIDPTDYPTVYSDEQIAKSKLYLKKINDTKEYFNDLKARQSTDSLLWSNDDANILDTLVLTSQICGKAIRKILRDAENEGLYFGYNWAGHRDEYFLATYWDGLQEEDWEFQCAD